MVEWIAGIGAFTGKVLGVIKMKKGMDAATREKIGGYCEKIADCLDQIGQGAKQKQLSTSAVSELGSHALHFAKIVKPLIPGWDKLNFQMDLLLVWTAVASLERNPKEAELGLAEPATQAEWDEAARNCDYLAGQLRAEAQAIRAK